MRLSALMFLFALAGAAPAMAAPMNAKEARKTFFGVDMQGVLQGPQTPWRECVTPEGNTSYWFAGGFDEGRLRVREDGALCFAYKSTSYSEEGCYRADKAGAGYRFTDVDDPSVVFIAKQVKRGVKACPGESAPVA